MMKSKKIALLGATGQTGSIFLELALKANYQVKALVRDSSRITKKDENLILIEGDVLNAKDVNELLEGVDVVVSLFGHVKGSPEWLQTDGTKNIISGMRLHHVDKVISLSGGGLPYPEKDQPKFADKLIRTIMKVIVPKVLNDAIKHHIVLKESGLKWSIVRAPRLTNDPRLGKYRVGWVGVNASTKISRFDLSDFILTQVEDDKFNHQMPFVSV